MPNCVGVAPGSTFTSARLSRKRGLGDPLPPLLELRLHDPHDRGAAVRSRADLEKAEPDLLQVLANDSVIERYLPSRARWRTPSHRRRSPRRRPEGRAAAVVLRIIQPPL